MKFFVLILVLNNFTRNDPNASTGEILARTKKNLRFFPKVNIHGFFHKAITNKFVELGLNFMKFFVLMLIIKIFARNDYDTSTSKLLSRTKKNHAFFPKVTHGFR